MADIYGCEMCERYLITTSHHLIPKQIHTKSWCVKMFSKDEMNNRRANLCRDCHPYLHKTFTHTQLGKLYNTVALIMANTDVVKHIKWVKKQRKKVKR
jgi:hypothetical protein